MNKSISLVFFVLIAAALFANNIQTNNVTLTNQNTSNQSFKINFDITWENSWRTSTNERNYDGAWIFAKFRKVNTSVWRHCTINYVAPGDAASCGHTQAGGATIKTSSDSKGVWMYRSSDGIGNVSWANNSLRWNYGVDDVLNTDSVEVRLYAVEMVYIPEGPFYLGSGSTTETNRFRDGAIDTYFEVLSEDTIHIGNTSGKLFSYGNNNMASGIIPPTFPKGFKAFWIMKHEISQQCYVDFLNTIDVAGANIRSMGGFTGTHPALVAPNPERAVDGASSIDILSWMDWAAMRPFTELEYEKACRGSNILPILNEYAWGNTTLNEVASISNTGTASESFVTGNCHYYIYNLGRPIRVGSIAKSNKNRVSAGATYYGVMEMSGNVWERAIAAGYTTGRAYTGAHGDGLLNTSYAFNVANWPSNTTGEGLTWRGGGYDLSSVFTSLQVSDRASASTFNITRAGTYGGRAARTAE